MIPLDPAILEFEFEWREGSRERAIQVANDFVSRYWDTLAPVFSRYSREALVREVDALRAVGAAKHHDRLVTDMWILSEFPLGSITGEAHVTVKIPIPQSRSKVNGNV